MGPAVLPGLAGVDEDGRYEYWEPEAHGGSFLMLSLGEWMVGELNGGVTGALKDPLCMNGEDDDDRFFSQGMRELASWMALFMKLVFEMKGEDLGLGKEDDVGLGL